MNRPALGLAIMWTVVGSGCMGEIGWTIQDFDARDSRVVVAASLEDDPFALYLVEGERVV